MDVEHRMQRISEIQPSLTREPITGAIRPATVEFIKLIGAELHTLNQSQLYGREGDALAGRILSVLAMQSADGVDHDNWLNEVDEPLLEEILNLAGALDLDSNQPDVWEKLLKVISELE